jgi:hypothetical protein
MDSEPFEYLLAGCAILVLIYTVLDVVLFIPHVYSDVIVGGVNGTLSLGTFSYCVNVTVSMPEKCYRGFLSQLVSNHSIS